MRCAVYLRQSVDRDREDRSISIESQKAEVEAWARENGAEVLGNWVMDDRDYSGSTAERPGFQRLLEAARSGAAPFDAILVYDYDRFFRNHRKQQRYLDELEDDHGIRVISVTEEGQPELMRDVKGVINQEYLRAIKKHTRKAMLDIASRGLSCGGTPPYGYRARRLEGRGRPVAWEVDPEAAQVVRRIYDAYAAGSSFDAIARMLNHQNLPSPGAGTLRNGRGWAGASIRTILTNETYTGVRVYNQTKKVSRKPTRQVRRPPEEWVRVPDAHEAIIGRELWERVQEVRRERSRQVRSKEPGGRARLYRRHLMSGHLLCADCGGAMTLEYGYRGKRYYRCRRSREGACANEASVRKDIIEEWFERLLVDAVLEPDHLEAYTRLISEQVLRVEQQGRQERRRREIQAEIGEVQGKIENLVRFLCGAPESRFADVRRELEVLERRRDEAKAELARLTPVARAGSLTRADLEAIIGNVKAAIGHMTSQERRQLQDELGLLIRVGRDQVGRIEVNPSGLLRRARTDIEIGSVPLPAPTSPPSPRSSFCLRPAPSPECLSDAGRAPLQHQARVPGPPAPRQRPDRSPLGRAQVHVSPCLHEVRMRGHFAASRVNVDDACGAPPRARGGVSTPGFGDRPRLAPGSEHGPEDRRMKTALVCGAGGFIGEPPREGAPGPRLLGAWRGLKHSEFAPTAADEFLLLDLRDEKNCAAALARDGGPFDEVYQLAADMGGMGFIHAAECEIMRNNVFINVNMTRAAAAARVPHYFFSSSVCIYRDMAPGEPELDEAGAYPAFPDNEYGWEKLYAERVAMAFARKTGMQVRIARFQNCYGPEGTWTGGREKAPAAICRKVAEVEDGGTIEVWGDGTAIRSYTYVDDMVDGIYRLMHSDSRRAGQHRLSRVRDGERARRDRGRGGGEASQHPARGRSGRRPVPQLLE